MEYSITELKTKIESINDDNPYKSLLEKQLSVLEQETCEFCHEPYKNMIDEAGWDLGIESDTSFGIKYFDLVMSGSLALRLIIALSVAESYLRLDR